MTVHSSLNCLSKVPWPESTTITSNTEVSRGSANHTVRPFMRVKIVAVSEVNIVAYQPTPQFVIWRKGLFQWKSEVHRNMECLVSNYRFLCISRQWLTKSKVLLTFKQRTSGNIYIASFNNHGMFESNHLRFLFHAARCIDAVVFPGSFSGFLRYSHAAIARY